jgi:magnesium transporter
MNSSVAVHYNPLLLPEIREMLAENDDRGLREVMTELHGVSIAEFAEGLTVDETWQLLSHADIYRQAEVFSFFPPHKQDELISGVGRERMSKLLEAMGHDDRADLLKRLDQEVVEGLLPLVAKADREDIRRLLSYPEHSAGSVMTTDYATLPPNIPVSEAISHVRHEAPHKETIYYVYVVDQERRLMGLVSLRELILAKPTALVSEIMQREVISVRVDQDQEEVARELAKFDFIAIPVVDDQYRLVGIITHDDVIDVVVEEATEDALRMGAVGALEEDYLQARFVHIWSKRATWLAILFVAELLTVHAMQTYEHALNRAVVLAMFVPLCMSIGGNSGSQAVTLITRALALNQVTVYDWLRVLRHELLMGLMLGVTLGALGLACASGLTAVVNPALSDQSNLIPPWKMGLVIAQAVAAICLWGTLVGSMLPLGLKRLGFDPGYASSPFVATLVDVTGILIYLSIANLFLPSMAAEP